MLDLTAFERYRPLVDDWAAFCDALARPLPVCVWANTLKATPERVAASLEEEGFPAEPLPWYPGAFRLPADADAGTRLPYVTGLYHIQEEVSLLPPLLLGPQPHERVLDLCAAPGNKTAQIAVALQNTGTVVANDRSMGRLQVVHATMSRLGIANASTTCYDAASFPGGAPYDRILADVPCSCEGTSRKHPGVLQNAGPEQSCRLGRTQEAILRRAAALCRPGGRIVYATCTYAPEENEAVVDAVLRAHGGALRLLPARAPGLAATPGLTEWEGQPFDASLAYALRVWPHQNDSGGFFAAVLEKQTA